MLTQLFLKGKSFNALELLALLQQMWPSQSKPTGEGSPQQPWTPTTASEWFWCAKQVARYTRTVKFGVALPKDTKNDDNSKEFWVKVGGRLISIRAGTLYARDCGKFQPGRKGAPKALSQSPDEKHKKIEVSYSGLFCHLLDSNPELDSKTTAAALRDILQGKEAADNYWPLPLLAVVMFISEVARNHTAFHTGLMLLDLIEMGVHVDESHFTYDLKNSLWAPGMIDAILQNNTHGIKVASEGPGNALQPGSEASMVSKGMGMGAMSHQLSESGGAFDLEGGGVYKQQLKKGREKIHQLDLTAEPDAAMTLTRRKEATLLIRWLSLTLGSVHKDLAVAVGTGNVKFEYSKAYELGAYFDSSTANALLANQYVIPLLRQRSARLDCMITETEL